jgi:hypothetical protein
MKFKLTIPDGLHEITLGQYQKYQAIAKETSDDAFLSIKMIEIFCNTHPQVVMSMRATDVAKVVTELTEMFNEKQKFTERFKFNGTEYGFIPKLQDMSYGEYVDIDSYLGDIPNMHIAMNALYRPVKDKYGERYNIEEYNGKDPEVMKDMPVGIAFGATLFFYNLGKDLSSHILNYLSEEEQSNLVQFLSSEQSGVGINQYTHLLREMLDDLNI